MQKEKVGEKEAKGRAPNPSPASWHSLTGNQKKRETRNFLQNTGTEGNQTCHAYLRLVYDGRAEQSSTPRDVTSPPTLGLDASFSVVGGGG